MHTDEYRSHNLRPDWFQIDHALSADKITPLNKKLQTDFYLPSSQSEWFRTFKMVEYYTNLYYTNTIREERTWNSETPKLNKLKLIWEQHNLESGNEEPLPSSTVHDTDPTVSDKKIKTTDNDA